MEAEKNAQKLVSHTTWAPQPSFPSFIPNPSFTYQPHPFPWKNPLQFTSLVPSQAANHAPLQTPKEELPSPPSMSATKEEKPNTQDALSTFDMIMPIASGSSLDFKNKRQRHDYFKQVHNILVDGPVIKTQWSHIPITFFEQDINLISYPHSDAMVIKANIQGWTIGKILVDTGSSADIIFSSTFNRMNINRNLL
jgi:hypothetical protein